VELIEANTKRLWGDDLEYESKDLLTVHSKVTEQIVSTLRAGQKLTLYGILSGMNPRFKLFMKKMHLE
jgi:hypothetical protein